jgi:hypothetical protein
LSGGAWVVHASSFANPLIYSSLRADLRQAMCSVFHRPKVTKTKVSIIEFENMTSNSRRGLSESIDSQIQWVHDKHTEEQRQRICAAE